MNKEVDILKRRLQREIESRKAAESILEKKAMELFEANESMKSLNQNLEQIVSQRTEELEHARSQAIQAQQAEQQFLASMSHEIRTPLNALYGMSHLLMQTSLDDQQKEYVDVLSHSANLLKHLVSDILDFAKIDSGSLEPELVHFDLVDLVRCLFQMFQFKNKDSNVKWNLEIDPSIAHWVISDPQMINQTLLNLMGNAEKFTHEGTIVMGLGLVNVHSDRLSIEFTVSDSGIGIKKDNQDQIFERFKQADMGTRGEFGGTGLGLPISQRLVQLLGGEIDMESEYGKGTRFSFTLEFEKGKEIEADESMVLELSKANALDANARVLVAEDNEMNRRFISALLEKWKVVHDLVNDGAEALRAINDFDYDIILMDMQMPVMDGLEATRAIRGLKSNTSEVPIVFLTANSFISNKQDAIDAGVNQFLPKPFNPNNLYLILESYLGKSNVQQDVETDAEDEKGYRLELLTAFCAMMPAELKLLEQLMGNGQKSDSIKRILHKIKPTFSMIGRPELTERTSQLEQQCENGKSLSDSFLVELGHFIVSVRSFTEEVVVQKEKLEFALNSENQ